jgi:hypothetical protein
MVLRESRRRVYGLLPDWSPHETADAPILLGDDYG